jgi:hypothetical protein
MAVGGGRGRGGVTARVVSLEADALGWGVEVIHKERYWTQNAITW